MARPTTYLKDVHPTWAEALCMMEDADDKRLAEAFGVAESTINRWKKEHPEFRESLKRGKGAADASVVVGLKQRAEGYRFTTKKVVTKAIGAKGDKAAVVERTETVTETFIPPDVTAAIYWTKNRDPENWRNADRADNGGGASAADRKAFIEASSLKGEELRDMFADDVARMEAEDAEDASEPPKLEVVGG